MSTSCISSIFPRLSALDSHFHREPYLGSFVHLLSSVIQSGIHTGKVHAYKVRPSLSEQDRMDLCPSGKQMSSRRSSVTFSEPDFPGWKNSALFQPSTLWKQIDKGTVTQETHFQSELETVLSLGTWGCGFSHGKSGGGCRRERGRL